MIEDVILSLFWPVPRYRDTTCPRVIRKLLRWMREKKLVELTNDEIKDMCENQLWEDTVRDLGF